MGVEVPIRRTRLTEDEAREALLTALRQIGIEPTQDQLALILAQSSLETGAWQKLWHYNFGNMVRSVYPGNYYLADDSGNLREFRAYPDAPSGALDYVKQILVRRPEWREGFLTGDPYQYAKALKVRPAYYEASESRYAKSLAELWEQYGGGSLDGATQLANNSSALIIPALVLAALVFRRKKRG